MNKLLFQKEIQQQDDHIFEVAGLIPGNYDGQAVQYDKLISSNFYNRIMWGNRTQDYANFCKQAIDTDPKGVIADIGCGTLSFSAKVYAEYQNTELYLCDLSLEMLRIGKKRVEDLIGVDSGFTFLRADALNLPFKNQSIQTLICLGFIHVLDEQAALLKELNRVLTVGGKLYLTSLCTDRKFSARYLKLLHHKDHVSTPKHSSDIKKLVIEQGFSQVNSHVKGGMVYISALK